MSQAYMIRGSRYFPVTLHARATTARWHPNETWWLNPRDTVGPDVAQQSIGSEYRPVRITRSRVWWLSDRLTRAPATTAGLLPVDLAQAADDAVGRCMGRERGLTRRFEMVVRADGQVPARLQVG